VDGPTRLPRRRPDAGGTVPVTGVTPAALSLRLHGCVTVTVAHGESVTVTITVTVQRLPASPCVPPAAVPAASGAFRLGARSESESESRSFRTGR
jgi:hypothetical protein